MDGDRLAEFKSGNGSECIPCRTGHAHGCTIWELVTNYLLSRLLCMHSSVVELTYSGVRTQGMGFEAVQEEGGPE